MTVVTRFAPSPTGYLHIGGVRTALFNWLFARRNGGKFLLRIEDTDRARSTEDAIARIFDGLTWLGLDWDGDAISQFSRRERHLEIANKLLAEGKAYRCYVSTEELAAYREKARAKDNPMRFVSPWRERDPAEAPKGVPPVIRFRAPQEGETVIEDKVQGRVVVRNDQLDDMILLRADGTPTYMLSVVVDDIDMGITHIVRGDDHLTNAARQSQLYSAIGAVPPVFAHVPLIHGPDGAKLSKRHGALGIEAYRDMGYLPEAMRNYLLRLGWGHGDEEIVPTGRALELFDLDGIGKAPARIDMTKLDHLNGHYLRISYDARLVDLIVPMMNVPVDETGRARLLKGMASLKERAKTLVELAENALFYVQPNPLSISDKAQKLIDAAPEGLLAELADMFATLPCFDRDNLEQAVRNLSEAKELKLGKIAQPLRAALTGSNASPPIFEVAEILGREETIARLRNGVDG